MHLHNNQVQGTANHTANKQQKQQEENTGSSKKKKKIESTNMGVNWRQTNPTTKTWVNYGNSHLACSTKIDQ